MATTFKWAENLARKLTAAFDATSGHDHDGSNSKAVTVGTVGADTVTNAMVKTTAAIVYSKLDLTGGIVNADVDAAAAIAFSKLAVSTDISTSGTVTDLTITSETNGDVLYFDGTNWTALAATALPVGIATGLAAAYTIEGGTNDLTVTTTTQTVGAGALSIPDFASVSDTFAFVTLAQTLANKTLTAPKIVTTGAITDAGGDEYVVFTEAATPVTYIGITSGNTTVAPQVRGAGETNTSLLLAGTGTGNVTIGDGADITKLLSVELVGATTAKTMTLTCSHTDDRALTLPDATDTLVGKATTDTFTNKILTDTTCIFGANGALTKTIGFDASALTAANKLTLAAAAGTAQTLTLPNATDTLVGKATADVFTNKTIDCDAAGNVITNVNANELDPITIAASAQYGVPFVIPYLLNNQAAAVNIFNGDAPFQFQIIDAWSISTTADGGTWKLNDTAAGAGNDITNAVTVAANIDDLDRPSDIITANAVIAASGDLSIVPDGAGLLDAQIYIMCIRT